MTTSMIVPAATLAAASPRAAFDGLKAHTAVFKLTRKK